MIDSTTLRRIVLALALLAAFEIGVMLENATCRADAIYWHDQCVLLADELSYYAGLD